MSVQMLKSFMKSYSSEILMGVGISGMVSSVVLAVKATPKALYIIDNKKESEQRSTLPITDVVKCTWKCYIPTALVMGVSIGCLVGSASVNARRNAVLATAYTLTDNAFHDYRNKVVETMGDKKDKEIREEISKDKIEQNPVDDVNVAMAKGGNTLCYDSVFGRYFESDKETIKKIENELNRKMRTEMFISLNDFYYEIGLEPVKYGEDLGWIMDEGYIDINYSSHLASNGQPCLSIDYDISPKTLQ